MDNMEQKNVAVPLFTWSGGFWSSDLEFLSFIVSLTLYIQYINFSSQQQITIILNECDFMDLDQFVIQQCRIL